MTVLLRTVSSPGSAFREIETAVRALDNTMPVYNVTTMAKHVEFALFPARAGAFTLNLLGLIGLMLTMLGLYGMLSHAVRRRTFEIGVRRALGARDGDVLALVIRQTILPVAVGLGAGVVAGLAASRALRGLLYGVEGIDPSIVTIAPLVLLTFAVAAAWAPAYRALQLGATDALRYE
jgi:putative ABC transport system permease protein